MPLDLNGPLDDFYERTRQIRLAMVTIEAASGPTAVLSTTRTGINLSDVGLKTGNTVNSMSLVFLASSFEEFIREELGQCADFMSERYTHLDKSIRDIVRSSYWVALLDRLKFSKSIMTKKKPKVEDSKVIGVIGALLDSARGFVVSDDASHIDRSIFYHHSRNFRPHVVEELYGRLGINNLLDMASDSSKLKTHFGVSKKSDVSLLLRAKINDFYERRNDVVHSLNVSTGYAVDIILDYTELFESTADSIRNVLVKTTAKW